MARRQPLLAETDLFGVLPSEVVDTLSGRIEMQRLRRGEHVCRRGEIADRLWVVFSGRMAVSARGSDGRESVMAVLGPGALFGELPLFDGGLRSADVRALTNVTLVTVLYEDVRAVLQNRPDVLWPVTRVLARRLRATNDALADAMLLDLTGRTAKRLLELAGEEDEFRMPLTQEELAAMVGASRERVNKAIATFVKLGWLEIGGRTRYKILDRAELEARAET
jgi:CRP-like cAMP-binding protein